jgi:predicted nucleic acid-binding Zn ribbon protein
MTTVMYSVDDTFRKHGVDIAIGIGGFKPVNPKKAKEFFSAVKPRINWEISAGILCWDIEKDGRMIYGEKLTSHKATEAAYFKPEFSAQFEQSMYKTLSRRGLVHHAEGIYSTEFRKEELRKKYGYARTTHLIGPEDAIIQELINIISESDARGAVVTDLRSIIEWHRPEAIPLLPKV